MNTQIELIDIADELLIINKHTVETLFGLDNASDCIALYIFYYKTAKWQKTNTIKASDEYVKKSLKWGMDKIRKTKYTLKENGLIDIIQRRSDGKIDGWYIKVSYLVSQKSLDDVKIVVESKNTQNPQVANPTSGFQDTNALRDTVKCLKNETVDFSPIIDSASYVKCLKIESVANLENEFETLWAQYPRKKGKKDACAAYIRYRKKGTTFEEVQKGLQDFNDEIRRNRTKEQFILHGSTWFNGKHWEDDCTSSDSGGRFTGEITPTEELDPDDPWQAAMLEWRTMETKQ